MDIQKQVLPPIIFAGLFEIAQRTYIHKTYPTQKDKAIIYCQMICNYLNIDFELMPSTNRKRILVTCRQLCMFFVKKYTVLGLKEIGSLTGGRHHSTVVYGIQTINDLMHSDTIFRNTVKEIDLFLNEHFKST